jgi:hypothetical protein
MGNIIKIEVRVPINELPTLVEKKIKTDRLERQTQTDVITHQ